MWPVHHHRLPGVLLIAVAAASCLAASVTAAESPSDPDPGAPPRSESPTGPATPVTAAGLDSIRWTGVTRLAGGRVLSQREVRRRLPDAGEHGRVALSELDAKLAALGAVLLAAGRLEAELELVVGPDGSGVLFARDGAPAIWDSLRLVQPGDSGVPSARLPGRGDPFRAERLERVLEKWVEAATEAGFPFAVARVESLRVAEGEVTAGIRLDPGPLCRVAGVSFPGRSATKERFLRRAARLRDGDPFRESHLERARRGLERSGLFSRVGAPEVVSIGAASVRIDLPVEEARHNRIEGAVGYSGRSDTFSGYIDLLLGNLFGSGRRLEARWDRPIESQGRLRLEWWEPYLGPLPAGLRASLEQEDRDSTYARLVLEGRLEAAVGDGISVFGGAEYHRSILGLEPAERVRRLSSVAGGRWDSVRPGAWRGESFETSVHSGRSRVRRPDGETISYRLDRVQIVMLRYQPAGERWVGLLGAKGELLGREEGLPVSDGLRFGGGGSVRGLAEESLLAQRYVSAQGEFGPAFSGNRAYLFLDAAWFRDFRTSRPGDRLGFGMGVGSESSGRRLRLDLGLPRGGSPGDLRLHLRLENRF